MGRISIDKWERGESRILKKLLLMIILLLVSMVNMVGVSSVHASPGTTISVDPSSTVDYALLPETTPETIRPMADGTYKDWTNKTLTIRPDSDGTFTDWVGHYTHWDDTPDTPASNVDGRTTVTGWDGWNGSPWLDASDYPKNYITSSVANDKIGNFTFADVPIGLTPSIVTLRIKTWKSGDLGGSDQLKIYLYNGTKWQTYTVTPTTTTAPGSYVDTNVFSFLNTRAKVNAAKMAIEHIVFGTADTIGVDHAYLRVEGSSVFEANVNDKLAVAGWDGWTRSVWRNGNSPWLGAADYPSNYISTSVSNDRIGNFTFADVPLYSCPTLRIKTWESALGNDQLKIYLNDGTTSWTTYTVTPTNSTAPGSYVEVDVSSFLSTLAKVNAAKMAIEHIVFGTADTIGVDHAYLSFTYVSATADGLSESSNLQDHTSETWPIARVQVSIVARTNITTDEKIAIMLAAPPFTYGFTANVDGKATGWTGWTPVGTTPWLGAADYPSNYIYSNVAADKFGNFTFANAPTGIIWNTVTVKLRLKTWTSGLANDQLKIYLQTAVGSTNYYTSYAPITPTNTTAPGSYMEVDVSSFLNTPAKVNAAKMVLEHIKDGGVDTIGVDHAYLYISATGVGWCGSSKRLSDTYSTYSNTWTNNPCTGLAWGSDWTAIDALQAGVQSVQTGTSWTGQIRVTQLYVVVLGQDGTYTEWDDDPTQPHDGDESYVSATMEYMEETSEMEDITSPPSWTIARVRVVFYARATETTDETVLPELVVGGISYWATIGPREYIPTTSYAKYTGDWGVNPQTSANWTWSDINLLQAGVLSDMGDDEIWTGEIRVTQLYVEVAGPRFTHRIMVADVTDLYAWQVKIYYNPTILEVTGVSLVNHVFAGKDFIAGAPSVDNIEGSVSLGASLMGEPPGVTIPGSGVLCQIIYRVIDRGVTPLYFSPYGEDVLLLDGYLVTIPASTEDGFFGNTILGDVTGDGTVDASDLSDFSEAYGGPALSKYNFNLDGKVDVLDLFDLSKNYGESIP